MDFFDKMGQTITNKGKDVAKKAKDIAEAVSLGGQVGTQEDVIDRLYMDMGRLLYQNKEDWMNLDLRDKMEQLDAAHKELDRLKAEIRRLKGIKVCENCGGEISQDACFCPNCGTQVPVEEVVAEDVKECCDECDEEEAAEAAADNAEAEPEVKACPGCGKEVESGYAYCPGCGTKLN